MRFVGERLAGWDPLPSQVEKVYEELTGKKPAVLMHEPLRGRQAHARSHGLASVDKACMHSDRSNYASGCSDAL